MSKPISIKQKDESATVHVEDFMGQILISEGEGASAPRVNVDYENIGSLIHALNSLDPTTMNGDLLLIRATAGSYILTPEEARMVRSVLETHVIVLNNELTGNFLFSQNERLNAAVVIQAIKDLLEKMKP